MSGLAAALRLALHEKRVLVLEKHELWGGLNSFYTLRGRPFDVGLHALTNFVRPGTPQAKGAPLMRLLRALRIRHEELRLIEQDVSEIVFPGARLAFANDFALLESEVARLFPSQRDGFARLTQLMRAYQLNEERPPPPSARALLERHLSEPLLREMLLLPVLLYGSAREDDTDEQTFAILFRALFLEGLSRPAGGIRTILNLLIRRLKQAGVELRLSAGVQRVLVADGRVRGVVLESAEELAAPLVLSCAGRVETLALAGRPSAPADEGRLSFLESIWILDRPAHALGHRAATSFYSLEERCIYRRPAGLIDARTGVLSSGDNFGAARGPEGELRLTVPASHPAWRALTPEAYAAAKERCADEVAAAVVEAGVTADFRARRVFRDVFTPATIERFTGHRGGAVYGSPTKQLDGATGLDGLVLIGTDQGYLGVVGAMLSGVAMANRHGLAAHAAREALSG
ncbi:MAG: NAD(P)/FAD-dependent oxidoreductase [Planctomycetes bacterium]|nr:NAD(P)/FAD-dependent oxidoreductase [Planctomycetota bacterium]